MKFNYITGIFIWGNLWYDLLVYQCMHTYNLWRLLVYIRAPLHAWNLTTQFCLCCVYLPMHMH